LEPTNNFLSQKLTHTHSGNLHGLLLVLHRSDRWPAPVRLVDRAGQAGGYSTRTTNVPESLNDFSRPWNKNSPKNTPCKEEEPFTKPSKTPPNQPRTDQHQHDPKTHESSKSPETNPTKRSHRSDRSRAPVRLVVPGQLGMNRTRESTPPNPTPDLPIHSTYSHKT
jgi:hypothetical protein